MELKKIINLKSFMGALIVALFICLFFSKTIYSRNLPEVTATLPYEGSMNTSNDDEKKSILVPSKAIRDFGDGPFVFQIKKRKGILGDEYYLYQLKIQTGDSDNELTSIISGMEYLEPVVLSSDKEIEDDRIVRVKNESDFFVDY